MEIIDPQQKKEYEMRKQAFQEPNHMGRITAGLIVLTIGVLLLLRKMGFYMPDWIFTWQILLIAIGMFIGAKERFRPGGWLIPVGIGVIFLLDRWIPELYLRPYFWPIVLIIVGLVMILSPGSRALLSGRSRNRNDQAGDRSNDEMIDSVSVFGGVKKNVISKNFRGGEIVCIFGGADINLTQADFQGKIVLEIVQIFGGTKLIVPSNWQIQSEAAAILGSIEDTRNGSVDIGQPGKVLVLKGVSIFGGISIKSY